MCHMVLMENIQIQFCEKNVHSLLHFSQLVDKESKKEIATKTDFIPKGLPLYFPTLLSLPCLKSKYVFGVIIIQFAKYNHFKALHISF